MPKYLYFMPVIVVALVLAWHFSMKEYDYQQQMEDAVICHERYVELRDSIALGVKDAVAQANSYLLPSLDSLVSVLSSPEMEMLQHESGVTSQKTERETKNLLSDLEGYGFHLSAFDDLAAKSSLWARPWEKSGWMQEFLFTNYHWQIASIYEGRRDISSLIVLSTTTTLAASQDFLLNYETFTEQIDKLQKQYREYEDIVQKLSLLGK